MGWQWIAGLGALATLVAAFVLWCAHVLGKAFDVNR
jgi:hypothetical protein